MEAYTIQRQRQAMLKSAAAAIQEAEAATKRLYGHGGHPIYEPREQAAKLAAIESTRREKLERLASTALEAFQKEEAAISKERAPLALSPLYQLPTSELQRVQALLPFVSEDISGCDWEQLPVLVQDIAALGDKALAYAAAHAIEARARTEERAAAETLVAGGIPDRYTTRYIQAARQIVAGVVGSPKDAERLQALKERENALYAYQNSANAINTADAELKQQAARYNLSPDAYVKQHWSRVVAEAEVEV